MAHQIDAFGNPPINFKQLLSRAILWNPDTCLLCHEELFWFKHSCEPVYFLAQLSTGERKEMMIELNSQALDKPTSLTWRQYI